MKKKKNQSSFNRGVQPDPRIRKLISEVADALDREIITEDECEQYAYQQREETHEGNNHSHLRLSK